MIDIQTQTQTPTSIIKSIYAKRLSDGHLFEIELNHRLYGRYILRPVSWNQWSFETAPAWQLTDRTQYKLIVIFQV